MKMSVPTDETFFQWTPDGLRRLGDIPERTERVEITPVYGLSLGLSLHEPMKVITAIKEGIPSAAFMCLSMKMGVNETDLAKATGIAHRTLNRRKREGKFKPDESERVYRIGNLFDMAVRVMGNEDSARKWFATPHNALGGKTPLASADTEPGAREVEDMLGRLEHGVFV